MSLLLRGIAPTSYGSTVSIETSMARQPHVLPYGRDIDIWHHRRFRGDAPSASQRMACNNESANIKSNHLLTTQYGKHGVSTVHCRADHCGHWSMRAIIIRVTQQWSSLPILGNIGMVAAHARTDLGH
eukprot:6178386-Pleurochrysis_carterae.AAC.4